ncbi:MAG: Family ership [Actinomycetota bacterium]
MNLDSNKIHDLIAKLSLEEKVRLVSGEDAWSTIEIPAIGLRKMVLSDGPSGVRGPVWDERFKSLTLPSATCTSATWNRDSLRTIGNISALEARSKGVSVVLGPTINLHRSPLGGRHFEAFSEDPLLTSELAVSYIEGVQENGVGTTPKHYVANDSENERFTIDARVDEQTLREVYLTPFEAAVVRGQAWGIMAAYNKVNGVTMTENELLRDPLHSEWGYDGFTVSDWTAVRSVKESASAATDLAMPGPITPWNDGLLEAVRSGEVMESTLDDKVARILLLAERVGALGESTPKKVKVLDSRSAIRKIAAEGMVLIENDGILPIDKTRSLAVIGQHAVVGRIGGGGSATTIPVAPVSPLQGILDAAEGRVKVENAVGFYSVESLEDYPLSQISSKSGEPGIDVDWIDAEGKILLSEVRYASFLTRQQSEPREIATTMRASTRFTAQEDGIHRFGAGGLGHLTLKIDGLVKIDLEIEAAGSDPAEAILSPKQAYYELNLHAGESIEIETTFISALPPEFGFVTSIFGYRAPRLSPDEEWGRAISVARDSEVAIVVVGTTALVESEGYDRSSLRLPGRQDELVEAIIEVNPNTIVIVNAGAPVEMPWAKKARAVLLTWFPGEEFGNALADVLFGINEPGGRLPTTWPVVMSDVPVLDTNGKDGVLSYAEGLDIGYRAWAKHAVKPAYHFGYGLGYTTWDMQFHEIPTRVQAGEALELQVRLINKGSTSGSHVVQVYFSREDTEVRRPKLWLAGFTKATVGAGLSEIVTVKIEPRAFAHWSKGWHYEPGIFKIHISSSADLSDSLVAELDLGSS